MKRGTTKFDLEKWFQTHPSEARLRRQIKNTKGPRPYHYPSHSEQALDKKIADLIDGPHPPLRIVPNVGTEEEEYDIGWAVEQMCQGLRVTRPKYRGSYIGLQEPDIHSMNTEPYIFVEGDGNRVPVLLQNEDLLALDWELATNV